MQVSTHTWQTPTSPKQRSAALPTPSYSMAVERVDDRPGRQRGSSSRGGRKSSPEEAATKTAHKQIFMARSLSSTLMALELSSLAEAAATDLAPAAPVPADSGSTTPQHPGLGDDAYADAPKASLDDLLSNLLSAA